MDRKEKIQQIKQRRAEQEQEFKNLLSVMSEEDKDKLLIFLEELIAKRGEEQVQ